MRRWWPKHSACWRIPSSIFRRLPNLLFGAFPGFPSPAVLPVFCALANKVYEIARAPLHLGAAPIFDKPLSPIPLLSAVELAVFAEVHPVRLGLKPANDADSEGLFVVVPVSIVQLTGGDLPA